MSYVAEGGGGGLHDLLRGFESFRNCKECFMATMVRPNRVLCLQRPFLWALGRGHLFPGGNTNIGAGCDLLGIGSAFRDHLTGIRSTRSISGTRQGIWSGISLCIGGSAATLRVRAVSFIEKPLIVRAGGEVICNFHFGKFVIPGAV